MDGGLQGTLALGGRGFGGASTRGEAEVVKEWKAALQALDPVPAPLNLAVEIRRFVEPFAECRRGVRGTNSKGTRT